MYKIYISDHFYSKNLQDPPSSGEDCGCSFGHKFYLLSQQIRPINFKLNVQVYLEVNVDHTWNTFKTLLVVKWVD